MGAPWHAQKKGRAVPTQCADRIFARGRAVAFYLAHRSSARLPAILDFGLMLALCAYAYRALDETMRLNDCSDEGSLVRSPWVERSNKASSADLDDRRATASGAWQLINGIANGIAISVLAASLLEVPMVPAGRHQHLSTYLELRG
jgi:hypothetical protein